MTLYAFITKLFIYTGYLHKSACPSLPVGSPVSHLLFINHYTSVIKLT